MNRDSVYFGANERVDLPDFLAIQDNARSDSRAQAQAFLFEAATTERVLGGWDLSVSGVSTLVVGRGASVSAAARADNSVEYGVLHAFAGTATKQIDLSAFVAATYTIYVRFTETLGEPGSRVFWDPAATSETVEGQATRKVVGWDTLVTATPPGAPWQAVGTVVWDGSLLELVDLTPTRHLFFEGDEAAAYANEWGAGDDRDPDRGAYGVRSLHGFVSAVRAQFEEVMGGGQRWWEPVPVSLAAHIADGTNPHGVLLQQDTLHAEQIRVYGALPSTDLAFVVDDTALSWTGEAFNIDNTGAPDPEGYVTLDLDGAVLFTSADSAATHAIELSASAGSILVESTADDVSVLSAATLFLAGVTVDVDATQLNIDASAVDITVATTVDFTASPAGLDLLMPADTDLDMGGGTSRLTGLGQLLIGTGSISTDGGAWDSSAFGCGAPFIYLGNAASEVFLYPDQWTYQAPLSRTRTFTGRAVQVRGSDQVNADEVASKLIITATTGTVAGAIPLDSIPDGATVVTITAFYERAIGGEGDISIALATQVNTTGTTTVAGSASDAGGSAGVANMSGSPGIVIDHLSNSYQINVALATVGVSTSNAIYVHAVRVIYTVPSLAESI